MKAVVFLGPTMSASDAREILEADIRPPAGMGDIYDVVERDKPDVIALIDGYFDSVPAVWHREVLFALSRGARVVGASSMGALRAAELWPFGMKGYGWVYESFKSGALEDDDEVAVAHGPADTGYRCVSEAMVNVRVGLARAHDRGIIDAATRDTLVARTKARFYPDRSWDSVLLDAKELVLGEDAFTALSRLAKEERPNVKREDACLLLREVAKMEPVLVADRPAFRSTVFWERLTKSERRGSPEQGAVRSEDLRRFIKATDPALPELMREGLFMHLVEKEFDALGLRLSQELFDAAVRDFRLRRGLLSSDAMTKWLQEAGLSIEQFRALMTCEARCHALLEAFRSEVDQRLLDAVALSGDLAKVSGRSQARSDTARASLTAEALEAFYRERVRQFGGTLAAHARELGFSSAYELLDEVRKIYEPTPGSSGQR